VEPFGDEPGFVPFNTAISFPLGSENPFAIDEVLRVVRWNKLPCLILEKSIKFKIHGFALGWILDCRSEASGFSINGGALDDGKESFWYRIPNCAIRGDVGFMDLVFGMCSHRVSGSKGGFSWVEGGERVNGC
jgi:hypothetical protein